MKRTLTVIMMVAVVGCTAVAEARTPSLKPKSPGMATTLSLLGTFVPTVLGVYLIGSGRDFDLTTGAPFVVVGTALGPSLGHIYAGNGRRAAVGLFMRLSIWGSTAVVASSAAGSGWDGLAVAVGAILAGTGLVTISSIYDIATAGGSARDYNRKHGLGGLSISPTLDLPGGQAGVRLSLRF